VYIIARQPKARALVLVMIYVFLKFHKKCWFDLYVSTGWSKTASSKGHITVWWIFCWYE